MDSDQNKNSTKSVVTYDAGFSVVQNLNLQWYFVLNIHPFDLKPSTQEKIYESMVQICGQNTYTEYEYAIEAAYDVLQMLGVALPEVHDINVFSLKNNTGKYKRKIVRFDGNVCVTVQTDEE